MTEMILKNEERAVFALRSLYRRYGYVSYKMSRFEQYDLYVRNKDFLVSDQIITFSGPGGQLLAMKPDVTMSVVKNAPDTPGVVQKVYYHENVYRDYREILQTGLECVGDLGDYEIAEVVLLAAKSLELLGENYVLNLSHMGLVAAVLGGCGLDSGQQERALEYLRRKNTHDLKALCGENDGAFAKLRFLADCRGSGREVLSQVGTVLTTEEERRALEELRELWTILERSGCRARLDFSVGSDMRYYSGVVFRGYLEGISDSVLSGGQYDKLAKKMGRSARAIGFAVYADKLQELYSREETADVDTLILHDGSVEAARLTAAAEAAAKEGTILVTRQLPREGSWKKRIRFEKGERVE